MFLPCFFFFRGGGCVLLQCASTSPKFILSPHPTPSQHQQHHCTAGIQSASPISCTACGCVRMKRTMRRTPLSPSMHPLPPPQPSPQRRGQMGSPQHPHLHHPHPPPHHWRRSKCRRHTHGVQRMALMDSPPTWQLVNNNTPSSSASLTPPGHSKWCHKARPFCLTSGWRMGCCCSSPQRTAQHLLMGSSSDWSDSNM